MPYTGDGHVEEYPCLSTPPASPRPTGASSPRPCARLRRRLGRKASMLNRPVLNLARALCERGAYALAFDFYRGLRGDPLVPYQGCGFGLLMNLRELMGEYPAPIGETLVIQR
jgi:hypothetical protein